MTVNGAIKVRDLWVGTREVHLVFRPELPDRKRFRSEMQDRIAAYREARVTSLAIEPLPGTDPVRMVETVRTLVDA